MVGGMCCGTLEKLSEALASEDSLVRDFYLFCIYTVDSYIACDRDDKFRALTYAQIVTLVCQSLEPDWSGQLDDEIDIELEAVFGRDTIAVMNFIGTIGVLENALPIVRAELARRNAEVSLLDRFLDDENSCL